jgi:UDP-N-acetylglucosamine diphosphorylase / glucose-1-phosphate thymidylyltransferase / UDP-N-acetylgalactosamine diphosphorylase / glucosamine-1-phosphate N-acetyltransferase / galactosamine-1-phosphate N-acetyltransferase
VFYNFGNIHRHVGLRAIGMLRMAKMKRFVIRDTREISPFNQPARELNVLNKPLWLAQRDALSDYCDAEFNIEGLDDLPSTPEEIVVHRDNLYFDQPFIRSFIEKARKKNYPCRVAITAQDAAFKTYALPLSRQVYPVARVRNENGNTGYMREGRTREEVDHYLMDLYYFPRGYRPDEPISTIEMDLGGKEVGYYSVPDYMSNLGQLGHFVTERTIIAVENWVHLFFANVPMGIFSTGYRFELLQGQSNFYLLRVLMRSLIEQTQLLGCSELVHIGRNCSINPSAVIQGPAYIGDNCTIGPGVVIQNCYIGNNVNIDQGVQLMLSVVGDGCFLPFRSALYLTVLMEHCIVAQNTCLQMCVVGRGSFIGAGSTFTDYNLLPKPLEVEAIDGKMERVGQVVLGSCVGHNCRIGSGMVIYPARSIESDVMLFAKQDRRIIRKSVSFEESDHHDLRPEIARLHKQKFPRKVEGAGETVFLDEW